MRGPGKMANPSGGGGAGGAGGLRLPDGPATRATCTLHCGDAAEYLSTLPDGAVDLVLTDPPYMSTKLDIDRAFSARDYYRVLRQAVRVAKPSAWYFQFGSLQLHALALGALGPPRFDYIWIKPDASLPPPNVRRPGMQHEQIYAWSMPGLRRPSDLYWNPEALRTYGHPPYGRRSTLRTFSDRSTEFTRQARGRLGDRRTRSQSRRDGSRAPTSLLRAPSKRHLPHTERTEHPTQKPIALCRAIVEGFCPPGGIVLDPFAGSGTVLLAARAAGRHGIGAELNPGYHAMAVARGAAGEPLFEMPAAAAPSQTSS